MRFRLIASVSSIILALIIALGAQGPGGVRITNALAPYGYIGVPYFYNPGSTTNSQVESPTGEKPQSKLWFNDGRWWASMFNNTAGNYRIYWLNVATQTWVDTGTVLDTRTQTKADCLWDGQHLYVASGGGTDQNGTGTSFPHPGWLYRYSYNSSTKTYTKDFGPVVIRNGGAETLVLDKDSAGVLWITYTQNSKVYVNHSRSSDSDWNPSAAFVVPTSQSSWTSLMPDDISTVVAFDNKIGVLWSNANINQFSNSDDTAFYFAYHIDGQPDTSWTSALIYRQAAGADDHINIKSLQSDPAGNLYAMAKTSFNTPGAPQLVLFVARKQSGVYTWGTYTHSIREEGQTRPMLLIDTSHRTLYVFTSDEGGGSVYYKTTSMDNPQFTLGSNTSRTFISKPGYVINNVTGTKQSVSIASGIVVLASHDNQSSIDSPAADYYFHNYIDLNTAGPTVTPNGPTATPTATVKPPTPTVPSATPTQPGGALHRVYVPQASS